MIPDSPPRPRYNAAQPTQHSECRMTDERLADLEIRLTYQEDLIEVLNNTVYQQQQRLEQLDAIIEALARQVRSLAEAGGEGKQMANERPPHY
jgi:SlyX protein